MTLELEPLTFDVNGTKTVVLAAGDPAAPPLVFLHGAGTFHGWQFAEPWTDDHRVLVPFHPGYGESGDLEGLREVHDLVLHYTDLFDQLGLTTDVNLVGFSLGGLLAARLAIEQKHRLRRLVLVAPTGLRVPDVEVDDLFRIPPEELVGRLAHRFETLAAAPARGPPRRRLHRRPLPGDALDSPDAVGPSLRPRGAALARPGRHPESGRVGRGGSPAASRRSRRHGPPCCRTPRWRRSRMPGTSSSTSRRTPLPPLPSSAPPIESPMATGLLLDVGFVIIDVTPESMRAYERATGVVVPGLVDLVAARDVG